VSLATHRPHPHLSARARQGPITVASQHATHTAVERFNTRLALAITKAVGTMWCAYAFGLMDLFSLPNAIRGGTSTLIAWIAQTFLQLVLLAVIMVGQNVQGDASDKRSEQVYNDVEAIIHEIRAIQDHLKERDT
jgi:hypothetical protein